MNKTLFAIVFLLTGCSQPISEVMQPPLLFGTRPDKDVAVDLAKLIYPKETDMGRDLDILIIKKDDHIHFVNRSTLVQRDVQVWLNKQYVSVVSEIPIGISSNHSLDGFINRYGEAFPVGGVLNPDKSFPIVLAEIFKPLAESGTGQRHKIVVRSED